jgi:tetratricopeptide (TPR) repeat protein
MATTMHRMLRYAGRTAALLLLLTSLNLSSAFAQGGPPGGQQAEERAENLQVLPEDTPIEEVRRIMSTFTMALGVGCNHCHVRNEGPPPSMDFAADDKPTKETARIMMRMVQAINGDHLTDMPTVDGAAALQVSCITCHHGVTKPQVLENLLADFLPANGVDSTLAQYENLREEYYGSASYDFTEGTLVRLAQRLLSEQRAAEALAFLERNAELYPNHSQTHSVMSQAYVQLGNRQAAITSLERAVALEPNNNRLRQQLDQLRAQ